MGSYDWLLQPLPPQIPFHEDNASRKSSVLQPSSFSILSISLGPALISLWQSQRGGNMTPNSSARPGPDKSSAAWLSSYWLHTSLHCYFKAKLCSMRVRAKKSRHKLVSFTTQLKMLEDRPGRKLSEEVSFCHGWCKELSILCEEQYR